MDIYSCNEHLLDTSIYSKISFNPHFFLFDKTRKTLINIFENNHLSKDLFSKLNLNIQNKKLPSFRILPKLHKQKFGIRPLINCSFSITSPISKFIDFILKILVQKHFTTIKDSQNFIQLTLNKHFNKNSKLFTSDFAALYTNIPLKDAITKICELISRESYTDFDSFGFYTLISLVLENNYFYFKEYSTLHFFLQIKGVAMGTSCGPSVANLYLAYFEIRYLHTLNVSLYYRFIDDNFFISEDNLTNKDFEKVYPNLELEFSQGNEVVFLDLKIKFDLLYYLNYDLYIKPTNTFSYLLKESNHPNFIYKNIVKSLLYRIRRICTDLNQYMYHSSLLLSNLLKRNYPSNIILNLIRYFSTVDRVSLIPYKIKTNSLSDNLTFITTFDRFLPNLSNFLNNIWTASLDENSFLKQFQFKTVYRNHPNLNSYLVNKISSPYSSNRYVKCYSTSCKICVFSITDYFLKNEKNLPILIPSTSSCNSTNCIYFISCIKCNKFYIGETSRTITKRMTEHLNKIRYAINKSNDPICLENFLLKCNDSYLLYKHFVFNHNINLDFKFQIFTKNFVFYRNRLETDLMTVFNTFYPNGLNTISSTRINSLENYSIPPLKN